MGRRDTIIVAVLVNTGLLALLFVLAVMPEDDGEAPVQTYATEIASAVQPVPKSINQKPQEQEIDEVDNLLKQFAMESTPQTMILEDDSDQENEPQKNTGSTQVIPKTGFADVTVKRGDSLDKIARVYNTSIEAIKKANNLTSDRLNIGQQLRVPVGKKESEVISVSRPINTQKNIADASKDYEYYVIKSGDNPWKIAKQFQVKFDELLKMNGLDEEKARNLKVGDKIRVK